MFEGSRRPDCPEIVQLYPLPHRVRRSLQYASLLACDKILTEAKANFGNGVSIKGVLLNLASQNALHLGCTLIRSHAEGRGRRGGKGQVLVVFRRKGRQAMPREPRAMFP